MNSLALWILTSVNHFHNNLEAWLRGLVASTRFFSDSLLWFLWVICHMHMEVLRGELVKCILRLFITFS